MNCCRLFAALLAVTFIASGSYRRLDSPGAAISTTQR